MGESKRRGSFETRKAAAIKRNDIEHKKWLKARQVRESLKTPEQRAREHEARQFMASAYGMISGLPYILK